MSQKTSQESSIIKKKKKGINCLFFFSLHLILTLDYVDHLLYTVHPCELAVIIETVTYLNQRIPVTAGPI